MYRTRFPETRLVKTRWWVFWSVFGLLLSISSAASAHSVQNEPSRVQIVARRDYLMVQISGDGVDWHDATSKDAHQEHTRPSGLPSDEKEIAQYAQTHLVLEQGGQVLPLTVQSLRKKKLRKGDDSSERVEIFLRASRPAKLANAPLGVASDLFTELDNAKTIVRLGDSQKVIQGEKTAEFPAVSTIPTLVGDMRSFASQGILEPLSNIPQLFMLATLFLGASLLPIRHLFWALAAFLVGQSLSFGLNLMGYSSSFSAIASLVFVGCIALISGISWWMARRTAILPERKIWGLTAVAFLAGLACGFSYLAPLSIWGLPENGLWLCGLAFMGGLTLLQSVLGLLLGALVSHWKRKFTHQAQYGGMDWPRAVQIASLACGAVGSFYGLQLSL